MTQFAFTNERDIQRIDRAVNAVERAGLDLRAPQNNPSTHNPLFLFRLTATLSPGGNAAAERIYFDSQQQIQVAETITVYDDLYGFLAMPSGDRGTFMWIGGRPVVITPTCCEPPVPQNCTACENNESPSRLQVDLAGFVDEETCSCSEINGSYVWDIVQGTGAPTDRCQIVEEIEIDCSAVPRTVTVTGGFDTGQFNLSLGLEAPTAGFIDFQFSQSPLQCLNWNNQNIPLLAQGSNCGTDGTPTCHVTSIL